MTESPRNFGGPVNLGNPDAHTIADAAADDPRQRRPEIALAAEEVGWRPRVDIATGVAATIRCFRGVIGEQAPRLAPVGGTSLDAPRPEKPARAAE